MLEMVEVVCRNLGQPRVWLHTPSEVKLRVNSLCITSILPTFCLSLGAKASGDRCCMNSNAGSAIRRLTQNPVTSGTRNIYAAMHGMMSSAALRGVDAS